MKSFLAFAAFSAFFAVSWALDGPSGLTSTRQTALSVVLKWTVPTGVTLAGYEIQRAPDQSGLPGQPVFLKRYTDAYVLTTYTDGTASKETTYHYRIRGFQAGFDGSEASALKSEYTEFLKVKTKAGAGDPKITGALIKPGGASTSLIDYEVLTTGQTEVRVYTVDGALARTLVNEVKTGPARYSVTWDILNDQGASVASGTYLVHVKSPDQSAIKKIVVVR